MTFGSREIRVIGGRSVTMSSAYQQQVQKPDGAGEPKLQPYGGKALSPVAPAESVTYRCRVYKYRCEGLERDEFVYTMINDTEQDPALRLPPGTELFSVSGSSPESVREKMKTERQKLGAVEITNWRTLGSL
jgi:hypothetical protein